MNLKSKMKLAARAISNSLSSEDQGVEATDILDTLKREHDEVRDLLEKLSEQISCAHRCELRFRHHLQIIDHILLASNLFGQARDLLFLLVASHHAV